MNSEVIGYKIENLNSKSALKPAYRLHGPRASYTLIRTQEHPALMFAINSKMNVTAVKGNYTWTDKDGEVVPYYGTWYQ